MEVPVPKEADDFFEPSSQPPVQFKSSSLLNSKSLLQHLSDQRAVLKSPGALLTKFVNLSASDLSSFQAQTNHLIRQTNVHLAKFPLEIFDVHQKAVSLYSGCFSELHQIVPNEIAYAKAVLIILELEG